MRWPRASAPVIASRIILTAKSASFATSWGNLAANWATSSDLVMGIAAYCFCSFSLALSSAPRLVVPLEAALSEASLLMTSFCST